MQEVQAIPARIILTSRPYLQSGMAHASNKVFIYVNGTQDLEMMLERLSQQDVHIVGILPHDESSLEVPNHLAGYHIMQTMPSVYTFEKE